jgi:hypothetical protein
MTPAEIVIEKFGGARALAALIGKHPSTVWRWQAPVEQGGLGGRVPSKVQSQLLALARVHGVSLTAADLISDTPVNVGAA